MQGIHHVDDTRAGAIGAVRYVQRRARERDVVGTPRCVQRGHNGGMFWGGHIGDLNPRHRHREERVAAADGYGPGFVLGPDATDPMEIVAVVDAIRGTGAASPGRAQARDRQQERERPATAPTSRRGPGDEGKGRKRGEPGIRGNGHGGLLGMSPSRRSMLPGRSGSRSGGGTRAVSVGAPDPVDGRRADGRHAPVSECRQPWRLRRRGVPAGPARRRRRCGTPRRPRVRSGLRSPRDGCRHGAGR